jgi:hypothetical protein
MGALVGGCVASAVVLRWYFAVGPHTSPSSDEAVVGLMAMRLLHGHLPGAFYWHQTYGGSLESVAVAPFIGLFGHTTLGLRSASVIFELTASWLVWRIARHLLRPAIAAVVGLVSLFFPLASVLWGTKERGFYPLTAALGFAAVLMALNVHERPSSRLWWTGFGLVAGVGWWMSPNIAYYVLPIALWLAVRGHWRPFRNVVLAAAAFVAGSSVWIASNVRNDFGSVLRPPYVGTSSTFASRFAFFWTHGLPFALGLRGIPAGGWYIHAAVGISLYVLTVVAFGFALRRTVLKDAPDIFLLAVSPFVFTAFIGNYQLLDGRYVYFLASMIPFVIGRLVDVRTGRVIVALVLAASTYGFVHHYGPSVRSAPGSTVPLARKIAAHGYRTAVANYWIAYKMTYESGEGVVASPMPGMVGLRYLPYAREVYDSRPAYLFQAGTKCDSPATQTLRQALDSQHIPFKIEVGAPYCAILPERRYLGTARP